MKSIVIITSLMLLTMQSFSQKKYSSQRPYLKDIYEVFDYVHRTMYSDDKDSSKVKLTKVFCNELFINKDRKVLNNTGEIILTKLLKIKSLEQGYDFQYCWIPIEKNQTDTTYEWYNKNQSLFSSMTTKFEDGTTRITNINIAMEKEERLMKNFSKMSCSNTTVGTVIRGKRFGSDRLTPNLKVLVYNEETDYWQQATLNEIDSNAYWVTYPNNTKIKVDQIIPVLFAVGDFVFYKKDNDFLRMRINKFDDLNIYDSDNISFNRNDIFFKINTYKKIDTDSNIFIKY